MKLEGSLDAFGLPDIFQLLSLTKKTGGLHLRSGASVGVVYFAEGAVTGADADLARQTLARRLVGSGAVADEALAGAVERAQSDGVGVGRALLDAQAVDVDLLRDAAAEVAYDAVFDLLRWPEGEFAFSPEAVNQDDVGLQLPTERVVTQAWTRQQALDSAADVIDAPSLVVTMAAILSADPELSRAQWALVAMADGHRTVGEIVDLTGQSYYTVVPTLAELVRKGLLDVQGESPDHVSAVRRRFEVLAALEDSVAGPGPTTPGGTGSAVHVPAPAAGRTAATASAPLRGAGPGPNPEPARSPVPASTELGSRVPVDAAAPLDIAPPLESAPPLDSVVPDDTARPVEIAVPGVAGTAADVVAPTDAGAAPVTGAAAVAGHGPAGLGGDAVALAAGLVGDPVVGAGPVDELVDSVGGPHIPENVLPPRPEPFLTRRQPEHPEVGAPVSTGRPDFGPPASVTAARTTSGSVFSHPGGGETGPVGAGGGPGMAGLVGGVNGSAAMAADPESAALIERDPSVNRSLLLRLIAGVRGL